LSAPPSWAKIHFGQINGLDKIAPHLQAGEAAAIGLALERNIKLVLLDDYDARREASDCGLVVVGTLRVLADAALASLVSLPDAFARLQRTNFRAHPRLYDALLAETETRR
jgi:predicted nucleic acid-binding protein